jgi:hypothetical protein
MIYITGTSRNQGGILTEAREDFQECIVGVCTVYLECTANNVYTVYGWQCTEAKSM